MSTSPPGPTKLGVAPNILGLLCYFPCIALIASVVVVLVEKENRFARFHAFQSLLVQAAVLVLWFVFMILSFVLAMMGSFGALLSTLLWFAWIAGMLGLSIFLMIKAYNGEEYALPTLGDMARNWV
jgi:uncharacterized membrane protein